jgi:hypothetical protein
LIFLIGNSSVFCQENLAKIINSSSFVVEGKVISQKVVKGEEFVFTYNTLLVNKLFKGDLRQDTLILPMFGGIIDGVEHSYSHSPKLYLEDEGIFCLNSSYLGIKNAYDLSDDSKGFLRYINFDKMIYADYFNKITPLYKVFENIKTVTNKPYSKINPTSLERELMTWRNENSSTNVLPCVEYSIQNPRVNMENGLKLEFDLYLHSFPTSIEFVKSTLRFTYDKLLFGSNIASSGKITISKGDLLQSPNYSISLTDQSDDKIAIDINSANLTELSVLEIEPKQLCHVSMNIETIDLNSILNLDMGKDFTSDCFVQDAAKKVLPVRCVKFQGGVIKRTIKQLLPPTLISFTPKNGVAAGIRDIITIYGDDLGTVKGSVEFSNAYDGSDFFEVMPNDILTWTDKQITVYVSSCGRPRLSSLSECDGERTYAGTGLIGVRKANQTYTRYSSDQLGIMYAVRNSYDKDANSIPVVLNSDIQGGIVFGYSDDFVKYPGAIAAADRALSTWRCNTLVNFVHKPKLSFYSSLIRFTTSLGAGIDAVTDCHVQDEICSSTLNGVQTKYKYMWSFTLNIRKNDPISGNVNWNTGTPDSNSFNMEPVLLHELGHAHLIQHTIGISDLMHWKQFGNSQTTILGAENKAAGKKISSISSCDRPNTSGLCSNKMVLINIANCTINNTNHVENFAVNERFSVYPNPTEDNFNIHFKDEYYQGITKIVMYNSVGQEVYHLNNISKTEQLIISTSGLTNGVYYITLFNNDKATVLKCIKQ